MRYRKYPNVKMSEKATLLKGDHAEVEQNMTDDVFTYWHYVELAQKEDKPDIYLKFEGSTPMFLMFSLDAMKQFFKLQTDKIDRDNIWIDKYIGKIFYGSIAQSLSNADWKKRRETAMKALGINFASGYIEKLVQCMEEVISKWKPGNKINFTTEISSAEFLFLTKILFGQDFDLYNYLFDYENEKGEIEKLSISQMMWKVIEDTYTGYFDMKGIIFPFLNQYDLCQPFTRTLKNCNSMKYGIRDFLHEKEDKNSLYSKLMRENGPEEEKVLSDLMILLFAGSSTTSHTITSVVYLLKKFPDVLEKCKKVYEEEGIIKDGQLQMEMMTAEKLDECDYVNYVIKEVMRFDNTAPETLSYQALDDINICGVPIAKGSLLNLGFSGIHYDPKIWKDPLKFIPERFDPESVHFRVPGTEKSRDPLSYCPFSSGVRVCPGQALARLSLKVACAILVSNLEYKVDQKVIEHEKMLFSDYSQYHLEIEIIKNKLIS